MVCRLKKFQVKQNHPSRYQDQPVAESPGQRDEEQEKKEFHGECEVESKEAEGKSPQYIVRLREWGIQLWCQPKPTDQAKDRVRKKGEEKASHQGLRLLKWLENASR